MSDGCEMFGQCMLESLLARRGATVSQGVRQGSMWVGILLIVAASAPLGLGAIFAKKPGERTSVAKKSPAAIDPLTGVKATKAVDDLLAFDAPMTAKLKQIPN